MGLRLRICGIGNCGLQVTTSLSWIGSKKLPWGGLIPQWVSSLDRFKMVNIWYTGIAELWKGDIPQPSLGIW